MNNIKLKFDKIDYMLPLVFVEGTKDTAFTFGIPGEQQAIIVKDFFISTVTVTQVLYEHIMQHNPAHNKGRHIPVECVSYDDIVHEDGFLARMNADAIKEKIQPSFHNSHSFQFRLPSETEWEYAAKGGRHWKDNFTFSGSNNIEEVAWFQR